MCVLQIVQVIAGHKNEKRNQALNDKKERKNMFKVHCSGYSWRERPGQVISFAEGGRSKEPRWITKKSVLRRVFSFKKNKNPPFVSQGEPSAEEASNSSSEPTAVQTQEDSEVKNQIHFHFLRFMTERVAIVNF